LLEIRGSTVHGVFSRAKELLSPIARQGFDHAIEIAERIAASPLGQKIINARSTGMAKVDDSFTQLDRTSRLGNPFPANGRYSVSVPREFANDYLDASKRVGRADATEIWITAAEDVASIRDPRELSRRLSLYTDLAGKQRKDTSNYVSIEFEFSRQHDPLMHTPIQATNPAREYGWVPGGRTQGGAREWLITPDAFNNGTIDRQTIRIRDLEK
jgi:hypothetical protein